MTIAVLFGSFNPLTNAHVTMLKEAVHRIGADRGLFVATNDAYLTRKTVKINDPFHLSAEERKAAIEAACKDEPNLEFWGFEMGGANPQRYKTLCKIQKQHPDAVVYEVQGADKVRSATRSRDPHAYLGNIRFAVFRRNDIDLDALFAANPILQQYRDSFTLLPPLADVADVSSTEVRRRWVAGEDYASLVPAASAELLSRYSPEDFSLSFTQRMKVIINSSRFGMRLAGREVYAANNALFHAWQAGNPSIDFGDYHRFLDNTVLYSTPIDVTDLGTAYPTTETGCINCDCVDLAQRLIQAGYNPAIHNLASGSCPGGGYDEGYAAQEESLCHSSTLSQSLYQYGDPKYRNVQESGVPHKAIGYPLNLRHGGIYTPDVTFFRHSRKGYFALRETPFRCDVITVAALSFNGRTRFENRPQTSFRAADGSFTPEGEAIMLDKIRTVFRMGIAHGKDSLVLGAFGCGAYKLPVPDVVRQFRAVMSEPEFAGKFRLIAFAIMESTRKPNGIDGKFGAFYQEFGTYPA